VENNIKNGSHVFCPRVCTFELIKIDFDTTGKTNNRCSGENASDINKQESATYLLGVFIISVAFYFRSTSEVAFVIALA
jgi:hypothetical protein